MTWSVFNNNLSSLKGYEKYLFCRVTSNSTYTRDACNTLKIQVKSIEISLAVYFFKFIQMKTKHTPIPKTPRSPGGPGAPTEPCKQETNISR